MIHQSSFFSPYNFEKVDILVAFNSMRSEKISLIFFSVNLISGPYSGLNGVEILNIAYFKDILINLCKGLVTILMYYLINC